MSITQSLDVTVRRQPRAVILDLTGEINAAAEATLNSAYMQAEQDEPELIVLNFARVDYMNSTGIALVVGLLATIGLPLTIGAFVSALAPAPPVTTRPAPRPCPGRPGP